MFLKDNLLFTFFMILLFQDKSQELDKEKP